MLNRESQECISQVKWYKSIKQEKKCTDERGMPGLAQNAKLNSIWSKHRMEGEQEMRLKVPADQVACLSEYCEVDGKSGI